VALNYSLYQLVTLIIMKHLDELANVYQKEFIIHRMGDLDRQHDQIREYRELFTEYAELIDEIEALDEKELSDQSFDKLKRLFALIISETEKFYYLAGLHDARQVLEGS
jgi:hypothetical protein